LKRQTNVRSGVFTAKFSIFPDPFSPQVLNVFERRNEHGLRYYDYKIHFQGWRPSYDRCVRAPVLVKDTEENRKLQRELAEAAQLQM